MRLEDGARNKCCATFWSAARDELDMTTSSTKSFFQAASIAVGRAAVYRSSAHGPAAKWDDHATTIKR
jgi:hypothetical protein